MKKAKILVIAVHPDDETLGCGGTLLKHKKEGHDVCWLIITNVTEDYGYTADRVKSRNHEINLVAKAYDFKKVYNLSMSPSGLNSENQGDLIKKMGNVINEFQPETIYLINRSDAHSDHRYTFEAVMACTKTFRYPFIKKIMMYECISETEFAPALAEKMFIPNYFVDISDFIEQKIDIMKIFASEIGEHPFPRSIQNIKALATFRGAMAGVHYAEAFQILKFIEK